MEVSGHLISNISLEKQMGEYIILTYAKICENSMPHWFVGLIHIEIYPTLWKFKGNPPIPLNKAFLKGYSPPWSLTEALIMSEITLPLPGHTSTFLWCILVGRRWSKRNKTIKWTCKINMFFCFPPIFVCRIWPPQQDRVNNAQTQRPRNIDVARFWRCLSRNSRQRRRCAPLCSSKSWMANRLYGCFQK